MRRQAQPADRQGLRELRKRIDAHPMLSSFRVSILVIACAGCGIGADDSVADSDDDLIDADGDDTATQCGELGLNCLGPLGLGECVAGECQGRLQSGCTGATCDEFCGSVGKVCAELGCGGATAYGFSGGSQEEADARYDQHSNR